MKILEGKRVTATVLDYEYEKDRRYPKTKHVTIQGIFLALGIEYVELEASAGTYSTGIILLDDGTIKAVPIEKIRLLKDEET